MAPSGGFGRNTHIIFVSLPNIDSYVYAITSIKYLTLKVNRFNHKLTILNTNPKRSIFRPLLLYDYSLHLYNLDCSKNVRYLL